MYKCPKCGQWASPFNHSCPAESSLEENILPSWFPLTVPFILTVGAVLPYLIHG